MRTDDYPYMHHWHQPQWPAGAGSCGRRWLGVAALALAMCACTQLSGCFFVWIPVGSLVKAFRDEQPQRHQVICPEGEQCRVLGETR